MLLQFSTGGRLDASKLEEVVVAEVPGSGACPRPYLARPDRTPVPRLQRALRRPRPLLPMLPCGDTGMAVRLKGRSVPSSVVLLPPWQPTNPLQTGHTRKARVACLDPREPGAGHPGSLGPPWPHLVRRLSVRSVAMPAGDEASRPQSKHRPYVHVQLPKSIRLPNDAYGHAEAAFHVVFRAMEATAPFRDVALADAVWDLIEAQNERAKVRGHAACPMPDHLHLVISPKSEDLIHGANSFKSFTTRASWRFRPDSAL